MQQMAKVSWDGQSYSFGDERRFLISGEFHYFRVPQADWRRRLRLWKDAGGNAIATYVPWLITHCRVAPVCPGHSRRPQARAPGRKPSKGMSGRKRS